MKLSRVLLATLGGSLLAMAAAAHADTFNLSFGTPSDPAGSAAARFTTTAILTGSLIAPGEYQITDITGTANTGNGKQRPIDSLDAPNTFFFNDNLLFEDASGNYSFDSNGLAYTLRNGAELNVYTSQTGDQEILMRANGKLVSEQLDYVVTPAVAATPEPGSFVLLGTGLLGVLGAARRRLSA